MSDKKTVRITLTLSRKQAMVLENLMHADALSTEDDTVRTACTKIREAVREALRVTT